MPCSPLTLFEFEKKKIDSLFPGIEEGEIGSPRWKKEKPKDASYCP